MPRWLRSTLAFLAGFAVLAQFPLPFWWFCGVHKQCDGGWFALQIAIATVIALAAAYVMAKIGGESVPLARDAAEEEWRRRLAADEAAHRAFVDTLRDHPAYARWVPLASRRLRVDEKDLAEWEARYQQLLADPERAWAAPRMLEGRFSTDLQIDYEADPSMRLMCPHLRPLEDALHERRIKSYPQATNHLNTWAIIDFRKAQARYALAPSVVYEYRPEHPHMAAEEYTRCTACHHTIEWLGGEKLPP